MEPLAFRNRSLLELGLVDSVEVASIPVLLSSDIPFLTLPANLARLKLVRHQVFEKTGTVFLEYTVV